MYKIILYNGGKRVKVIKKYLFYKNALNKYKELISNNKVYFSKEYYSHKGKTDYELVLIGPKTNKSKEFIPNNFGGKLRIKAGGDFSIRRVEKYQIEETFLDKIEKEKINFKILVKKMVKNKGLTNVVYLLNNKVCFSFFEKNDLDLYVLKNRYDSRRLFFKIHEFVSSNDLSNFIFFDKPLMSNKKELYDILENTYGISRDYMQKVTMK